MTRRDLSFSQKIVDFSFAKRFVHVNEPCHTAEQAHVPPSGVPCRGRTRFQNECVATAAFCHPSLRRTTFLSCLTSAPRSRILTPAPRKSIANQPHTLRQNGRIRHRRRAHPPAQPARAVLQERRRRLAGRP